MIMKFTLHTFERFLFIFLLMSCSSLTSAVEVERVEPANWWLGMERSEVQVLLYGDSLGYLRARLDAPGVTLLRTVSVENPAYLFVYLRIETGAQSGPFNIELLDGDRVVTRVPFELWERRAGSAERSGFGPEDAIYLLMPDRFANGDPTNDSMPGMGDAPDRNDPYGRHGGDLAGLKAQLPYIASMGMTAIWLNPILENKMPESSYHGYATTDFYGVDPRYGSNEMYRELVTEAHAQGLKIIMDMIPNHVGSEHWFVKDPPCMDWINYGGEYVNTIHRRTTVQDMHASERDRRAHADGWFVASMPDLNQRNPLMADYLIQNAIWWVEYADLDGIRVDTYPYPDRDFMADWSCALMTEYPNLNIVGEEWALNPSIPAYWQRGKLNPDGYRSCLPSLMDFPVQNALVTSLTRGGFEYESPWVPLYEAIAMDFLYPDPWNLVTLADNHDMDRFMTQVGGDEDLFRLGMVFLATIRGIPQVYYGTELGMNNDTALGSHGAVREEFPGGWEGDKKNAFTGQNLSTETRQLQEFMRHLFTWRKRATAIHSGKLMHFAPVDDLYVYFRYTSKEAVLVALNLGEETEELDMERYEERLRGFRHGSPVFAEGRFVLSEGITVPPRGFVIIELQR
jgi:glycosidase